MAITHQTPGTYVSGTTALTPPLPTGYAVGDLFLLVVESPNVAISLTTANGFVEIGAQASQATGAANAAGGVRLAVYYKFATNLSQVAPVLAAIANHQTAQMACFRGVNTVSPWDATAVSGFNAAAAQPSWPAITTNTAEAMVVNCVAHDADAATNPRLTAQVNASLASIARSFSRTVTTGVGGGVGLVYGIKTTAGSVNATTGTEATTTTHGYLTLALKALVEYNFIGTVSTSASGSVSDTGQKGAKAAPATSASGAVASSFKKTALNAVSASVNGEVSGTVQKSAGIIVGISAASTFTISGIKSRPVVITQASTITVVGKKTRAEILSTSSGSSIDSGGKKGGKTLTSTPGLGTVAIASRRNARGNVSASASGSVAIVSKKKGMSAVSISPAGGIVCAGKRGVGTSLAIMQGATVVVTGKANRKIGISASASSAIVVAGKPARTSGIGAGVAGNVTLEAKTGRAGVPVIQVFGIVFSTGKFTKAGTVSISATSTSLASGQKEQSGISKSGEVHISGMAVVSVSGQKSTTTESMTLTNANVTVLSLKNGICEIAISATGRCAINERRLQPSVAFVAVIPKIAFIYEARDPVFTVKESRIFVSATLAAITITVSLPAPIVLAERSL